jgi:hypothetical protein
METTRLNAIAILLLATALMLSGCVREIIKEGPLEKIVDKVVFRATPTPTPSPLLPAPPTPDIEATVDADVKAVLTAVTTTTPFPKATPGPTATQTPTATPRPTPTPKPLPVPTLMPSPRPTATPIPLPTPTPTHAEEHDLTTLTRDELTLYYDPLTPEIQLNWALDSYAKAVELVKVRLGISSPETTMYLLNQDMYTEVYRWSHLEWTQGFALGTEMYVNRAPVKVWDTSVTDKERIQWLGAHVQEITERVTAHELTHAALDSLNLPRWIDEGMAEYIEFLIAPGESTAKQLLQRRYSVRDAINRGLVPTEALLNNTTWLSADSLQEFRLLYATSALVVQLVADTSGDKGLRELVEASTLGTPLDSFIDNQLRQELFTFLPEELAANVVCGLRTTLQVRDELVSDWNANDDKTNADYVSFTDRARQLLESVEALAADTLVEEARLKYGESFSEFITATDYYARGGNKSGYIHLVEHNSLNKDAYQLYMSGWDKYVVVPCTQIEEQLP